MTTPSYKQLREEIVRSFHESFPLRIYGIAGKPKTEFVETKNMPTKIESFLLSALDRVAKATADALEVEEKVLPRRFDCPDCVELNKELDRDDATCAMCNGERGHNSAVTIFRAKRDDWFNKEEV